MAVRRMEYFFMVLLGKCFPQTQYHGAPGKKAKMRRADCPRQTHVTSCPHATQSLGASRNVCVGPDNIGIERRRSPPPQYRACAKWLRRNPVATNGRESPFHFRQTERSS